VTRRCRQVLAALLAVIALHGPAGAEPPARPFDERGLQADLAVALDFIAPRSLEVLGVARLAMGGLRSLPLLDAGLRVERQGTALVLGRGAAVVLRREAPAEGDATGWATAATELVRAAWDGSEPVRQAGNAGVVSRFFAAMFAELDPYSRYLSPREAGADRVGRAGRAGVGITVELRRGVFVVNAIEPGGPAAQAGLRAGDVLLAVDGQPVAGASATAVAALLAGPEATSVWVTTRRGGTTHSVTLERSRAASETVMAQRDGRVVVIRMAGFNRNTASRLAQELIRAMDESAPTDGVVLDLRGNRGGVLQQAVASAAMLQAAGVVVRTSGRHPDAGHVLVADGRDLLAGRPVVVLIDGDTASAAEILAGALADQRRAVVVGSVSLGKGLVQAISALPDGGEILVSWSQMIAPRGWPIQSLGVLPQLCTSLGAEQTARQIVALAHGEQMMRAALQRHRGTGLLPSPVVASEIRASCPPRIGDEADVAAARALIASPASYAAALLGPDDGSATRMAAPQDLTGGGRASN